MKMDIDIVYTWCDNADEKWRAKREAAAAKYDLDFGSEAHGACRYRSNDDLRHSLRSLEMYAPWVRRIFLVVDDVATLPEWLDTKHPKLRVVRHSEILKSEHRPSFCSGSIEHSLMNIPDLAEHFLLANDDVLFNRPTLPSFFFAKDGCPIIRMAGKFVPSAPDSKQTYMLNLQRAMDVFRSRHDRICRAARLAMRRVPHHNIDAYCKSDMLETRELYRAEIEEQLGYPFRRDKNIQRLIYALEALQRGHGHLRISSFNTSPYGGILRRMLPAWADSIMFVNDLWRLSPQMLERFQPKLICYNDTAVTTDAAREWLKGQYARLYPTPSAFEAGAEVEKRGGGGQWNF